MNARLIIQLSLFTILTSLFSSCAAFDRTSTTGHRIRTYFGNRPGDLIQEEVWTDIEHGSGHSLLDHVATSNICVWHTNQDALGGASYFRDIAASADVSTNAAPVLNASGTAVGSVIGAAIKSTVK